MLTIRKQNGSEGDSHRTGTWTAILIRQAVPATDPVALRTPLTSRSPHSRGAPGAALS